MTAEALHDPRVRRGLTVPSVLAASATLGAWAPVWVPIAAGLDLLTAPRRMPRLRLLSFALAWSTLESVGVGASAALWAAGRGGDEGAHFALQRWWAARLVDALHFAVDVDIEVSGIDRLVPGPVVICARHVSIADALLPAWLLGRVQMRPRYVLKDDLLLDPCLDIVGNRLPNHFVDRDPDDSVAELARVEALAHDMDERDAAVIFPEGMIVTDARRQRAIDAVVARDPERGEHVRGLRVLAPVRPGGTAALLRGAPDADLVFLSHRGLESLQRLADAPAHVPLREAVRVDITRVRRNEVPDGAGFTAWLDRRWAECDRRLAGSPAGSGG